MTPATPTTEATRSIADDQPTRGTTTTVTLELSTAGESVTVVETFSPPVEELTVLGEVPFAAVRDDADALVVTAELAECDSLSYEVVLPPDGQSHTVTGVLDVVGGEETTVDGDDTIEPEGVPPVTGTDPPTDLNGDGLYEDIDGDGEFDIFDVQTLFNELDSPAVQNYPEAFNFAEDDEPDAVDIFDVQALFNRLAG